MISPHVLVRGGQGKKPDRDTIASARVSFLLGTLSLDKQRKAPRDSAAGTCEKM
jgi:hypothetical protein